MTLSECMNAENEKLTAPRVRCREPQRVTDLYLNSAQNFGLRAQKSLSNVSLGSCFCTSCSHQALVYLNPIKHDFFANWENVFFTELESVLFLGGRHETTSGCAVYIFAVHLRVHPGEGWLICTMIHTCKAFSCIQARMIAVQFVMEAPIHYAQRTHV